MMVIVGDGFRDSTTGLLEYLQKFMHLQFTIRLVELQLFRPTGRSDYPVLVVPRLTARTQEVTRAIVRIQPNVSPSDVVIEGVKDQQTSPGTEGFIELLKGSTSIADEFASFLGELALLDIYADPTKDGLAFRWPDPHESGQQFRIFRARRNGNARFGVLASQLAKQGRDTAPALRFARSVAALVPGTTANEKGGICGPNGTAQDVPLQVLLKDRREDFLTAIKRLLDEIRATDVGGDS